MAASARGGYAGFGAAMLGALWAYDGWNNVAPLSGEIRNPQRNLPRAFIGGMLVVASLYVFVNRRLLLCHVAARDCERADDFIGGDRSLETFFGADRRLDDRRRLDGVLVRFIARQRAGQFPRSLRDGSRRSVLSRPRRISRRVPTFPPGPLLRKPHGAAYSHCQARTMRSPTRSSLRRGSFTV